MNLWQRLCSLIPKYLEAQERKERERYEFPEVSLNLLAPYSGNKSFVEFNLAKSWKCYKQGGKTYGIPRSM